MSLIYKQDPPAKRVIANLKYGPDAAFSPDMLTVDYQKEKDAYDNEIITHDNRNTYEKRNDDVVAWGESYSPGIAALKVMNPLAGATASFLNSAGTYQAQLAGDFSRSMTGNGVTTSKRKDLNKEVAKTTSKVKSDAGFNTGINVVGGLAIEGIAPYVMPAVKKVVSGVANKVASTYASDALLPVTRQLAKIKNVPVPRKAIQDDKSLYRGALMDKKLTAKKAVNNIDNPKPEGYGYFNEWGGENVAFTSRSVDDATGYATVKNKSIHEDLYDNMMAAGKTPEQFEAVVQNLRGYISKYDANKMNIVDMQRLNKETPDILNNYFTKKAGGADKVDDYYNTLNSEIAANGKSYFVRNRQHRDLDNAFNWSDPGSLEYNTFKTYRGGGSESSPNYFSDLPGISRNTLYRDNYIKRGIDGVEDGLRNEVQHFSPLRSSKSYRVLGNDMVKRVYRKGGILYTKKM